MKVKGLATKFSKGGRPLLQIFSYLSKDYNYRHYKYWEALQYKKDQRVAIAIQDIHETLHCINFFYILIVVNSNGCWLLV